MSAIMKGKKGLIVGVANSNSIAWGIASKLAEHGADLAFTYQGDTFGKRVRPLAKSVNSSIVENCDVEDHVTIDNIFKVIEDKWGELDFLVHSIAFSDRHELTGKYADTTKENFIRTMVISCFSFTELGKRAAKLMKKKQSGSLLTLTYCGAQRVMPNYNVMGVAKAGLETSVKYLAADFGRDNIRVNALSAGPVRTLAGAGITDARLMYTYQRQNSLLGKSISLNEIGNSALYLLSDLSSGVTGEIHFVDAGYNNILMPKIEDL